MIHTPVTPDEYLFLLGFMLERGVKLPRSDDLRFICRSSNGRIIGCVGYNNFNGQICAMHFAGDGNWISREFIKAAFDYPFIVCACVQIFATVASSNQRAIKLAKHFGLEVVYRIPQGYDEVEDMVVLTLRKSQCRYLEGVPHGIKRFHPASTRLLPAGELTVRR